MREMAVNKPVAVLTVVALCGFAVAAQQAPPAQQPLPSRPVVEKQTTPDPDVPGITFRSEVNYVEVDARVLDDKGNFVRDLRQDEFELFEDGELQSVTAFQAVDIPVTKDPQLLFASEPVERDVRTNVGGPEGRVYVLVLDDLHTSMLRSLNVRQTARQFIERNLGANDVAAVIHTSGRGNASQEFTNSQRLLTEAIDKFAGQKLPSITLEMGEEYGKNRNKKTNSTNSSDSGEASTNSGVNSSNPYDKLKDPLEMQRGFNARVMLEAVGNVSKVLANVKGRRKALILFSEGIEYDVSDVINRMDAMTILDETREAIAEATRANVNVYAIDPRGLSAFGDDMMELQTYADADPNLRLGPEGLADELRRSHESLQVIAEETGGFAAVNTNDTAGVLRRIVDENSSYYVMGYHPSNERRDGRFRKIEVRVTRPGLRVSARKGYMAPKGRYRAPKVETKAGTSPELVEALNHPLQTGGLPLSVFAAPFRGPAPSAAVALITQMGPMKGIPFSEKGGKFTNKIELSVIVIDAEGKVRGGSRETVDMNLRPETRDRANQLGFRMLSRFEVPPGKYQIRVAAREKGGRVGSVHYDLVVPDYSKEPLSMSGLVLTSALAGMVPTAGEVPEIKSMLPTPPTAARAFDARDKLGVLTEIYDTNGDLPHSVDITTTVRSDDGRIHFSTSDSRSTAEFRGKSGGFGYTTVIPLKDLADGFYLVRVEAQSTLRKGDQAAREVIIRVAR
jgi:VWFA-related protein